MKVNEVYGPTVQGEGPYAGRRCAFVRLARCNLTCAWCDTPFTWDWEGLNGKAYDPDLEVWDRDVQDVAREVDGMAVNRVVITGGEPLIQRQAMVDLCTRLTATGYHVEVETNGTIAPAAELVTDDWVHFNVSPKLAHAGMDEDRRIVPDVLDAFAALLQRAAFKFVVRTPTDLDEVDALVQRFTILHDNVWIMPEGQYPAELQVRGAALADEVIARGYNLTQRLHVLTWGHKRGV